MAQIKFKDVKDLDDKQLNDKLHELKKELIKVSVVSNQEKNSATLKRNLKRNIARVLTAKNAKK